MHREMLVIQRENVQLHAELRAVRTAEERAQMKAKLFSLS